MVAFRRPFRRLGVAKGEEWRTAGVEHAKRTVLLEGPDGATVGWKPSQIGGRRAGTEVYRAEGIEVRAGDCTRWNRNDAGLGFVNSTAAEVPAVRNRQVIFRLEFYRTPLQSRHEMIARSALKCQYEPAEASVCALGDRGKLFNSEEGSP